MNKRSMVFLLSIALLVVSGSLFAAGGQRGAWVADTAADQEWTPRWMVEDQSTATGEWIPRWMSEEQAADTQWAPRWMSEEQTAPQAATGYMYGTNRGGYAGSHMYGGGQAAVSQRGYARTSAQPFRTAGYANGMGAARQQVRTPIEDCLYLQTGERQYLNQRDTGTYGRMASFSGYGRMR